MGLEGTAMAINITFVVVFVVLLLWKYLSRDPEVQRSNVAFKFNQICVGLKAFLSLAMASFFLIMMEEWSYQLLIIIAGLIDLQSQTVVLKTMSITALLIYLPQSMGLATSTLVGKSLGEANLSQAKSVA